MVQPAAADRNALHELGYKIFLDRYALKDMTRATLAVGDTVIVVVNPKTGQREVGTVEHLTQTEARIKLLDGEVVTRGIENVDKPLETRPEQMMDRVAAGIAQIEATDEKRAEWAEKFRWLLDGWKFVPGGRILTGAGTDQQLTYYNCYVIPSPRDSRGGIMETLSQMTEIMSRGGGVGINISTLRPRHAYVKGVNGRSSGSVSWGALYSFVTGLIEQGGCFGPNERIATDKGLIPAAELADRIDAGEVFFAQTHKGWRQITMRFRNGEKDLYEVVTERGYRVHITAEHKVAVLRGAEVITIPLHDLTVGDEILVLMGEGVNGDYVALKPVEYDRSIMSTKLNTNVTLPESLTEDLAYLIGYSFADGYVHIGKKVNWTAPKALKLATADAHPTIRERLVNIVASKLGLTPTIENGDGAIMNVSIYSRLFIEWLAQNGLLKQKAEAIRVPEAIFRSPSSVQLAFIAGYFDADGCNRGKKGGYGIDSISLDGLRDLQQLLAFNGIISRIHTTDRSEQGWQTIYRLNVTGRVFKERFSQRVPAEKVSLDSNGLREENTYPATVWTGLGARAKYRQRIYDGVSDRISPAQLMKIGERLTAAGETALAGQINALLNVMPDPIAAITPVGRAEVYDFEVDDVHLISGNGVYTSNSRRGALMLILNDWHPDVFNFINSKRQAGQITNANISVGVSDALMEAVEADADWDLLFPDTSDADYDTLWDGDIEAWQAAGRKVHVYKTVKAREVWNAIIESAWASAEPGVWFRDRSNKLSNSHYFSKLICTNPCGEQSLPAFGICNLGAINLAAFYDAENHDVAWEDLGQAVRYGVRFLDDVIDGTPYFFEENARVQGAERRVGLGTMGVAELMVKLQVRYGSPESLEFIDRLYYFIAEQAYLMSADIAAEKGSFPAFDAEKFLESGFMLAMPDHIREAVREKGIRNVTLLTQAPTGTTGTMVNTSTGIEPFFSWVYYRKSRLGLHEERVPVAQSFFDTNPDETQLPDYFITAMELSPEDHIRAQAAFQRWVDSSISKTANVPNHYTVEQVSELYKLMYQTGCKGGTIYRDGSRDEQVLMLKGDERAEKEMAEKDSKKAEAPKPEIKVEAPAKPTAVATPHRVYPRPKKLQGMTVTTATPFGTAYVTMNLDEQGMPFEVFITAPGKAGSDLQADAEGLGRLISLSLRTTDPHNRRQMLKLIVEQLRDIGGARAAGFGVNRVTSLPDAVARALEENFLTEITPAQLSLPLNGETMIEKPKTTSAPISLMDGKPNGNGNGHHAHEASPSAVEPSLLAGADMCPECHTISLIRAEGCRKCMTCGYSEC